MVLSLDMRVNNLAGRIFGRLVVLERTATPPHISRRCRTYWLCRCSCGSTKAIPSETLLTGRSKSCGCLHLEIIANRGRASKTHGASKTPEYRVWAAMKRRCSLSKGWSHRDYIERGISVCARWQSFESFFEDMGPRPSRKHSLDRTDNDGPYSKKNCQWALPLDQANNRRSNRFIEYQGRRQTLAQWSRETGIASLTIRNRLGYGWTIAKTLTEPTRKWPKTTHDHI